jgi:hypothetical protein
VDEDKLCCSWSAVWNVVVYNCMVCLQQVARWKCRWKCDSCRCAAVKTISFYEAERVEATWVYSAVGNNYQQRWTLPSLIVCCFYYYHHQARWHEYGWCSHEKVLSNRPDPALQTRLLACHFDPAGGQSRPRPSAETCSISISGHY